MVIGSSDSMVKELVPTSLKVKPLRMISELVGLYISNHSPLLSLTLVGSAMISFMTRSPGFNA